MGVADRQIDSVYFEVNDYFLEYFDALHSFHLLSFVQQLLHHLLALLGVAHLSDLLHFLVEAHAVDHLIVDVFEQRDWHFCQDGEQSGVLGGGEFLLFGQLGDDDAVGLLPALVEGVPLSPIFDDVEAVVVEVLNAVENLAQLPAVHLDVDAVYYHAHLHHVSHVRCEPLRAHRAQPNGGQVFNRIGRKGLELLRSRFFGTGGRVVGEGMCHHSDEKVSGFVLVGVI